MRAPNQRTDVLPATWEIPIAIGLLWLAAMVLVVPVGQGIACWIHGVGFAWPGPRLGASVVGLMTGHPGRGLAPSMRRHLPPAELVYVVAALLEAALAAVMFAVLVWWGRALGPLARVGLASRHEVAGVLGYGSLMRRRRIIRPDLADRRARSQ